MIISHEHKYIFIKTEKTAGTSIEIALSKFCGEHDVITPISPEDEEKRNALGFRGPQNYHVPFGKYSKMDWLRFIYNRKRLAFYNHAPASFIREYIDTEIWDSYFKFCFERNPWDKAISWYYWATRRGAQPPISQFIQSGRANRIKGFDLYTLNGELVVDRVFRFEALQDALKEISEIIGLPEVPVLPQTKSGYRKEKRSYRDVLSEQDRDKIAMVFARELAYFGYKW